MKNTLDKIPLVSVVIPAYNREKLLPRALESVWIQNFDDIEIVIVDDGSSDNTQNFLEELQKKTIEFAHNFMR